MKTITQTDEFKQVLTESMKTPVFLFKHSTACNVSAGAWMDFHKFAQAHDEIHFYKVLVIENRAVSNKIETETGIRHQSPQVLLFRDGKVVWNESHWRIDEESLSDALSLVAG